MSVYGGIEAGGTKFVCAVGSGPDDLRAEVRFPTTTPGETVGRAIAFFQEEWPHEPLAAIGIASFGPIDPNPSSWHFGYVTSTPKPGWAHTDFAGPVHRALGVPVGFDTDVNVAALGEHRWGAAQGLDTFIYLTIGTGLGGGGMVNGKLIHGLMHPEMGHVRIPHDWEADPYPGCCLYHGDCLEGLAAGPALEGRWGQRGETLPPGHPAWELEAHYLAGGHVHPVVRALVAASKADIRLSFDKACAIDLAGRDVLEGVRTSVKPKVIDCPDPSKGRATVDGVAVDGIQVKAKARVTVRTNLDRLVGGAGEETIIARVGEGIVSTIGSSASHKRVLENPDTISKTVLAKGLDAGTAYEILSIDIADVDVGENIGARLQADQAEADKRVAQAMAEKRRAMAVAEEQENLAKVRENEALVMLAQAEVPKAIAQAFREGNLGLMDYYSLKNIQADTAMRQSISGGEKQGGVEKA